MGYYILHLLGKILLVYSHGRIMKSFMPIRLPPTEFGAILVSSKRRCAMTNAEYVSDKRRHIRYLATFDGLTRHGETYAYSRSEVLAQLQDAYANKIDVIQIQFLD